MCVDVAACLVRIVDADTLGLHFHRPSVLRNGGDVDPVVEADEEGEVVEAAAEAAEVAEVAEAVVEEVEEEVAEAAAAGVAAVAVGVAESSWPLPY